MKTLTSLLFAVLILTTTSCQDRKKTFSIPAGHVGMFGYGSLMSRKMIETGLLTKHYDGPYLPAHLNGYKRSWSFAWPSSMPAPQLDKSYYKDYILVDNDTIFPKHLHYLNIRQQPGSVINGVLYLVPEADLPTYDGWELGYERFDVTDSIADYEIDGGRVFAYRALPGFLKEPDSDFKNNIIELSYSNIIQDAFEYWGKEFEAEYKLSTVPVDPSIIRDNKKLLWLNPPLDTLEKLKASFNYPE